MRLDWMTKIKIQKNSIYYLLAFSLLFFLTRVPRLNNDVINPDEVNWHYRTEQFINGLKYHQWEKTYQHYHPGVTVMWITGVSTEAFKQLTGVKTYNNYTFEAFAFVSKFALVFVQLILSLYIIFILRKFFGISGAVLLVSLFTFEPFFLGNSRLYHLDALLALLVFAGLLTGYLAVQRNSVLYFVATGILFALAFLTKSLGIIALVFYLAWYFSTVLLTRKKLKDLVGPLLVIPAFVTTTFALFPALWVKPIYYLTQIFSESERVGLRRGHEQILFGNIIQVANPWFYLAVTFLKSSPLILIGVFLFVIYAYRLKKRYQTQINGGFILYLATFTLLYLLAISFASKKIDRYITLIYPMLAVFSYYGLLAVSAIKNFKPYLIAMVLAFIVWPLFHFFPFYFIYTNPLFGTSENANKIIGQKSFGVGIYDLKLQINSKYGEPRLGFIDTKPMEAIYPNSKVFDIRVTGAGDYDLLILGINENMPADILKSKTKFVKSSSVYINDLEYWRVYEKV